MDAMNLVHKKLRNDLAEAILEYKSIKTYYSSPNYINGMLESSPKVENLLRTLLRMDDERNVGMYKKINKWGRGSLPTGRTRNYLLR